MRGARLLIALGLVGGGIALRQVRRARRKLDVVDHLELGRYMGHWHEIARIPSRFERSCSQGSATYRQVDGETVSVTNRCDTPNGPREVNGVAKVVDAASCARLKVRIGGPFWGDYQILHVDDGYLHAVVGTGSRRFAWVLSRRPSVDDATYAELVSVLADQGFDVTRLVRLDHVPPAPSSNRAPDPVAEAGRESFPASDPPSFSPGHA